MNTINLNSFFQVSQVDISELIREPNILAIHILHMYYYIKDWYKNNKYIKLMLCSDIIENKNYINNNIKKINISNLTLCGYISIIYNESPICSSITTPLLYNIEQMYQKNVLYYAIYITFEETTCIIFNYDYHKKILLIDITTLNIIEFKSINDCIENVKDITKNIFKYQILRIVRRPYSFEEDE
jgi:hypothetical protein